MSVPFSGTKEKQDKFTRRRMDEKYKQRSAGSSKEKSALSEDNEAENYICCKPKVKDRGRSHLNIKDWSTHKHYQRRQANWKVSSAKKALREKESLRSRSGNSSLEHHSTRRSLGNLKNDSLNYQYAKERKIVNSCGSESSSECDSTTSESSSECDSTTSENYQYQDKAWPKYNRANLGYNEGKISDTEQISKDLDEEDNFLYQTSSENPPHCSLNISFPERIWGNLDQEDLFLYTYDINNPPKFSLKNSFPEGILGDLDLEDLFIYNFSSY